MNEKSYKKRIKDLKKHKIPYSKIVREIQEFTNKLKSIDDELDKALKSLGNMYEDEVRAREQLDEIQEIYFGARQISFVPSVDVRTAEVSKLKPISEGKSGAKHIKELIIETLDIVKALDSDKDSTVGEKDLLSKIAGTLQQKLYFLQQFTK